MKLGHAYTLKSKDQPYVQFRVLTYFLWFTELCRVLGFKSFSQKL